MPRLSVSAAIVILCAVAAAAILAPQAKTQPNRAQQVDELAYAIGFDAGEYFLGTLEEDELELDIDSVIAGVEDAMMMRDPKVSRGAMRGLLQDLEEDLRQRRAQRLAEEDPVYKVIAEQNLRASREFHQEFGAAPGAVTLPSGVQYRVLRAGEGPKARLNDTVVVSYEARLIDGFEYAESTRRVMEVADALDGGRIILQQMRAGDRWLVAVPPEMAYGELGKAPDVGPNESIIIEVELHEIRGQ